MSAVGRSNCDQSSKRSFWKKGVTTVPGRYSELRYLGAWQVVVRQVFARQNVVTDAIQIYTYSVRRDTGGRSSLQRRL